MGITKAKHNEIDMIGHKSFYVADHTLKVPYHATPRIGIKVGLDKHWRFVAKDKI